MLGHVLILRKTSTEDKKTVHSDNNKKMKKITFLNKSTRSLHCRSVSSRKKEGKLFLTVEERRWSEETKRSQLFYERDEEFDRSIKDCKVFLL